jgi:probable rRNA maturation factor
MIEIDVSISDPAWEDSCDDCEAIVTKAIEAVFQHSPVAKKLIAENILPEVSVVLANDDLVHTLNRDYRDKDKTTNILSFAMLDTDDGWQSPKHAGPCALGDLILAYETVKREAEEEKKTFNSHLTHLVIHGTLHLLGYDHIQDDDAEIMETLEIQILSGFNIGNPYIPA